jgi:hypothetical protein
MEGLAAIKQLGLGQVCRGRWDADTTLSRRPGAAIVEPAKASGNGCVFKGKEGSDRNFCMICGRFLLACGCRRLLP